MRVWTCKVVIREDVDLPLGADLPMRAGVRAALQHMGFSEDAMFSGWGGEATPVEIAVMDNKSDDAPFLFMGDLGALMSSVPIPGFTQDVGTIHAQAYGGRHFICETITKAAGQKIASLLGYGWRDDHVQAG